MLYRDQLPQHFADHGLPALKLTYLNKLTSLGEGPPVAAIYLGRRLYDPAAATSWLKARIKRQEAALRKRTERSRNFHRKKQKDQAA